MKLRTLVLAILTVAVLGAQAQARGVRRPRRKWADRVRKAIRKEVERNPELTGMRASDAEKPLDWLTDFDQAAELAGREKRPLMVLFTSEELARTSTSCRFKANSVRRAARGAKVVPVRLLPPVMLSSRGVPKEEAAKRRELHAKAQKRYREVVRKYGISTGPCLVLAASDAARLNAQVAPTNDQIRAALARLGEMIEAHEKALEKAGGAKKEGEKPKEAAAKKPEEKKPEVDPEEDF